MESLALVYLGLAVLGPLFALAQRLRPAAEGAPSVWARGRLVDWSYWVITPLVSGLISRALVVALGALVAMALGATIAHADDVFGFFAARSLLRALPEGAQLLVCLALVDLLSYASHRLRHHALFFPLHAIHHSAEELDWLAAARMHPLDEIVDNVAITLPILFLGPAPWVLLCLGPITLLYTLFTHAAIELPLGPLRFVIVGPAFHRVHHAADVPGVNYAGMIALWDVLFGTFRDPASHEAGRDGPVAMGAKPAPLRFGLGEEHVPPSVRAHLVAPVMRFLLGDRASR
ncbi:MAG: sterol desaturase family protein [Sandaracinaceae bacterium]|nr:sterol desaturase family protein [Sandaracinaceae bacterium]